MYIYICSIEQGLGRLHLTSTEPCTYERWKSKDPKDEAWMRCLFWLRKMEIKALKIRMS